jgi:hypothetical protein
MEGKSEVEPFERDTVVSNGYLLAAVEAELHADAAEDALSEAELEQLADRVEERTGIPVRMAYETDIDPSFEMSVYQRNDGDFPGLLFTTSVERAAFEDDEAAVEELQQRRDTIARVCEDIDFTPSVLPGEELADIVERYRSRDD